jgi:hypothetical protein
MARKSNSYRSNNHSATYQRGKLRRILNAQKKAGVEVPSIPEIRDALAGKVYEDTSENIQE